MLWSMDLQVVTVMLPAKDSWSSGVTSRFLAVCAADTTDINTDGGVVDERSFPWKEEQLSLVHFLVQGFIHLFS